MTAANSYLPFVLETELLHKLEGRVIVSVAVIPAGFSRRP